MNLPIQPQRNRSLGRPQILMLTHRVPYPPDRGDRIRSWNILRHLSIRADVSLGCICDEPLNRQTRVALESVCRRVAIAPVGPRSRWLRAGTSAICGGSVTEGLFWSPRLASTLEHWADSVTFDAALVYCSSMLSYTKRKRLAEIPKVVDLVDADSQKWQDYAANAARWKRPLYRVEAKRIRALERLSVRTSRAVTLVSDVEAHILKAALGDGDGVVHGLSNGVDTDYFDPNYLDDGCTLEQSAETGLASSDGDPQSPDTQASHEVVVHSRRQVRAANAVDPADADACTRATEPANGSPFRLVFIGALNYHPNVSGLQWFAREIWPLLRDRRHGITLDVVGRNPCVSVQRLGEIKGITIVGAVPDVRPYVAASDAVIAPLRIARGIQNKVLEAMAMSKPVIATSQAAEGIDAVPNQELLLAEAPEEWADRVERLANSPELGQRFGKAARQLVLSKYNWTERLKSLDRLLGLEGCSRTGFTS